MPCFKNGAMVCSCKPSNRILKKEYDFILDQRNEKELFVSPAVDKRMTKAYNNRFGRQKLHGSDGKN